MEEQADSSEERIFTIQQNPEQFQEQMLLNAQQELQEESLQNSNQEQQQEQQLPTQQELQQQQEQQLPTQESQQEPQQQQELPQQVQLQPLKAFEQPYNAEGARRLASHLIHTYFTTQFNPLTRHHIESYDQFIQRDLSAIISSYNPILVLKNPKSKSKLTEPLYIDPETKKKYYYIYNTEIYIGGQSGTEFFVGTPTISLDQGRDVRTLFPNEARLRNLTYSLQIEANILVRITILNMPTPENRFPKPTVKEIHISKFQLCSMPLMLHSRYCILHGKPSTLLQEMGECPRDQGGYFIIDGSEKVLVTRQEGAFNTLWIKETLSNPELEYNATISSLNPKTREVKRVNFNWTREKNKLPRGFSKKEDSIYSPSVLEVEIPFVIKPLPIFVLFRALGIQSDKDILQLIFPDFNSPESKYLADLLIPSINAARPFLDTYTSIQYIKSLTKLTGELGGVGEARVLDIIHTQLFPHVEDLPNARATFLADCVRKILRTIKKVETPASRDDTQYQRLLTSGFLCQILFQNIYATYIKAIKLKIDETFSYNESTYTGENFYNIFSDSNRRNIFMSSHITQGLLRGFKGKWRMSSSKEESGLLQELDRLSYLNFMSHLRHVTLNFDTGMKLQGPRRLNPSQYGYFCTSETPSGASIGITKNLSIMTAISTGTYPDAILKWLFRRGGILPCEYTTPSLASKMIPVYLNSGIIGYSGNPKLLARVLRLMKRSGYLPPLCSSGFSIPERKLFIYSDDGRPLRPLLICEPRGMLPSPDRFKGNLTWRDLVVGTLRPQTSITSQEFNDPLEKEHDVTLESYITYFEKHMNEIGVIEYIDPYEQNEILLANWPEHVLEETTHMEVHPSTILGLLGNMIPYPNHNQSPRNQLSASQSKQGLSIYATNWKNRYDNTANVLCYGQAPLSRTIYQDYIGDGKMSYGQNIILAMGMYGGYNQEDGIIMNADALARGQFRSINYRSYETFEEDDTKTNTKTRIGNPEEIPDWLDIKVSNDYSKLDSTGIIKVGEYVTQSTVLVGKYRMGEGPIKDESLTPQVWTRGRVDSVVVTVNNSGLRLIKIRVVQDRVPELGDKFSNRHGQKGTINILYRGHDMPRTIDGITPDMIMNPTAIPSRMTIGQVLEMILGNVSVHLGAIGNCTAFMNDGSPNEQLGSILESLGLNKMSNQVLYNGMTGEQITADIFMGVVYGMRLKHMTEDKWNARGEGRKEQRTRQPTGGRGNEGGLKIGEMERDAIIAHGITSFVQESYTKRSDGASFIVCNGCGTIPIFNERQKLYICTLCNGPIQYSGDTVNTLDPIPPSVKTGVTFSKVKMPYATNVLFQELNTFMNVGLRILTTSELTRLKGLDKVEELNAITIKDEDLTLPEVVYEDTVLPKLQEKPVLKTAAQVFSDLARLQEESVTLYQADSGVSNTQGAAVTQGQQVTQEDSLLSAFTSVPLTQPQEQQQQPQQQQNQQQNQQNQQQPQQQQPQQQQQQQEHTILAKTELGAPILNIDTSDAALAELGLRQPGDATKSIVPLEVQPQYQQEAPPRRRIVRSRQPAQQYQQPQQPQEGQQNQQEQRPTQQFQQPIRVEKLG